MSASDLHESMKDPVTRGQYLAALRVRGKDVLVRDITEAMDWLIEMAVKLEAAERERNEFKSLAVGQSDLAGRNAARAQKAEADEDKQQIVEEYDAAMCASNEAGYVGVTAAQTIRYLMQRAEAAEAEIARRDAATGEPVAYVPKGHIGRYLNGLNSACWVYGERNNDNDEALFTAAPPAVRGNEHE